MSTYNNYNKWRAITWNTLISDLITREYYLAGSKTQYPYSFSSCVVSLGYHLYQRLSWISDRETKSLRDNKTKVIQYTGDYLSTTLVTILQHTNSHWNIILSFVQNYTQCAGEFIMHDGSSCSGNRIEVFKL